MGVGVGGCVGLLICWPAGEALRPRRGFCLRIMSEATCIWMNNFIELNYCGLCLGSRARGNYGDKFYYPSPRILRPPGLPSPSVIICFSFIIWAPVSSLWMVVDSEALCCPHIWRFAQSSGRTLTLNSHPKHVPQGLSLSICFVKLCRLLLAANSHVLFRDQSTQD